MTCSIDPTIRQIQQRALGLTLLAALALSAVAPLPFAIGVIAGGLTAQFNFFLLARSSAVLLRGGVDRARLLAWCGFLARYSLLAVVLIVLARWQLRAVLGAAAGFLTIIGAILTSLAVPFAAAPAPREA